MSDDGEEHDQEPEIPLHQLRPFGAGLKRKRVQFVPASDSASPLSTRPAPGPASTRSAREISNSYLDLVLKKKQREDEANDKIQSSREGSEIKRDGPCKNTPKTEAKQNNFQARSQPSSNLSQDIQTPLPTCSICHLPLTSSHPSHPHEANLAHQVSLPHSHPPSSVDRRRKGLAYLMRHGWDPDARQGLGSEGQGIQYPIKVAKKEDTLGVGATMPTGLEAVRWERERNREKLDAGQVRKLEAQDKRKAENLRSMFYGSEDVDRYLGHR